jgi:hypothetical protein
VVAPDETVTAWLPHNMMEKKKGTAMIIDGGNIVNGLAGC